VGMTTRDLGELGIKLIGIYFGALAVLALMGVLASFTLPPFENVSSASIAIANSLSIAGYVIVAAVCIVYGGPLATRILAERRVDLKALSARDLLVLGLTLLGVRYALTPLPGLLKSAGQAIWYAEASRQSLFLPTFQQSWPKLVDDALQLVVGVTLVTNSRKIAAALDRHRRAESRA
jgi:hypothetical protein